VPSLSKPFEMADLISHVRNLGHRNGNSAMQSGGRNDGRNNEKNGEKASVARAGG